MFLRTEKIAPRKVIGQSMKMTLASPETRKLWQGFMPRRNEIQKNISNDLISMQVFDPNIDYRTFSVNTPVERWAAMEVANPDIVPEGMSAFTIPEGLYAVFLHVGASAAAPQTFQYIYGAWFPRSEFQPDNSRPHFEILGAKYKNDDAQSEEEIWIPIKPSTL